MDESKKSPVFNMEYIGSFFDDGLLNIPRGDTKGELREAFDSYDIEDSGGSKVKEDPESLWARFYEGMKSSTPRGPFYLEEQEAAAADKVGGSHGYGYPLVPPYPGAGQFATNLKTLKGIFYGSDGTLPRKFLQKTGKLTKGELREAFGIYNIESSGGRKEKESPEFGGWGRSLLASGFGSPPEAKRPWEEVYYTPLEKVGGFHGYDYLPGPPNIGTGNSAGTLGMQGGLMILMFAVCYMLYMILKKRVCSLSIGWKDTDGGGELELGGPRDA